MIWLSRDINGIDSGCVSVWSLCPVWDWKIGIWFQITSSFRCHLSMDQYEKIFDDTLSVGELKRMDGWKIHNVKTAKLIEDSRP